jgi:hypothetical protein
MPTDDSVVGNLKFLQTLYLLSVESDCPLQLFEAAYLLVELLPELQLFLASISDVLLVLAQLFLKGLLLLDALAIRLVHSFDVLEEIFNLTLLLGHFRLKLGNSLLESYFGFFIFLSNINKDTESFEKSLMLGSVGTIYSRIV